MESRVINSQIQTFRDTGTLFLRHSGQDKTKLHLAVEKMVKKLKTIHENFLDQQSDIRADHAATDPEKKILLKDNLGNYQFTPEKDKACRKALRDLANKHVVVEPHYVSTEDMPNDLSFSYEGTDGRTYTVSDYDVRDIFKGFVIKPESEE